MEQWDKVTWSDEFTEEKLADLQQIEPFKDQGKKWLKDRINDSKIGSDQIGDLGGFSGGMCRNSVPIYRWINNWVYKDILEENLPNITMEIWVLSMKSLFLV